MDNNNLVNFANKVLQKCLDNVIIDMNLDNLGKFYICVDDDNDAELSFYPYILGKEVDSNGFSLAFVDEKGNITSNLNNIPDNNYQVRDLRSKDTVIAEKFVEQVKSLI